MPDEPLIAHSLAEIQIYLMVTLCPECKDGQLKGDIARSVDNADDATVVVDASCDGCETKSTLTFRILDHGGTNDMSRSPHLNGTLDPSRILDVGQWITAYRMILESASRESKAVQARNLKIEASLCLGEALKFLDDPDNDLPPPEAFFTTASRARFHDAPQTFSRRRIISLRSDLPHPLPIADSPDRRRD